MGSEGARGRGKVISEGRRQGRGRRGAARLEALPRAAIAHGLAQVVDELGVQQLEALAEHVGGALCNGGDGGAGVIVAQSEITGVVADTFFSF